MPISLAAALFGLPPAPGCTVPDDEVPAPWLMLFLDEHADAGVYGGIFTSCTAGRLWVLRTAPKARLVLRTTKYTQPGPWYACLARDRAELIARGHLPTRVIIVCGEGAVSEAALAVVPSVFYGHAAAIQELRFSDLSARRPCAAVLGMLQLVLPLLQQLRSLTLNTCIPTLPPRSSLPQLTEVQVYMYASNPQHLVDSCLSSIAAYLPQLTSLTLHDQVLPVPPDWQLLLSPASTTNTLTAFSTDRPLDDTLLSLLVQHTPTLTRLRVAYVGLQDDHSDRQWGVRTLVINQDHYLEETALLPKCAQGKVTLYILGIFTLYISETEVSNTDTGLAHITLQLTPL